MAKIFIEGGKPLSGTVRVSGAKNSALKLIHAAMFSNDDVILKNVPRIGNISIDLQIIREIGGTADWVGEGRLRLNGAGINTFEIPYELGSKYRTAALLAAPLLYRFGRAIVPLPGGCKIGYRPINRWIETWKDLGIITREDEEFVYLERNGPSAGNINFKINTHMGTDNAVLSSLFVDGEIIINNAAEEPEVEDLIAFCNLMGAQVERLEPRIIKVTGQKIFKGCEFTLQPDRIEVVTFAVAALVTRGNINIVDVDRGAILSFLNVLTKMGAKYEFSDNDLRVWRSGETLMPVQVTTAPAPGFMTDWQPLITLLLTQAEGESLVHDTVYTDRFGYVNDFNRMGANIELLRPSEAGLVAVISDDGYNIRTQGEPKTVAKIKGPTNLSAKNALISDLRAGATLVIAGLAAEGTSILEGYENVTRGYEHLDEKLRGLGAKIEIEE